MLYEYECKSCKKTFERTVISDKRDDALKEPCPNCEVDGQLTRMFFVPPLQTDGIKSLEARVHPDFAERMKSLRQCTDTKYSKTTINY
jgi:hypothetical protein